MQSLCILDTKAGERNNTWESDRNSIQLSFLQHPFSAYCLKLIGEIQQSAMYLLQKTKETLQSHQKFAQVLFQ